MLGIIVPVVAAISLACVGTAQAAVRLATFEGTVEPTKIFRSGDYYKGAGLISLDPDYQVSFLDKPFKLVIRYNPTPGNTYQDWLYYIDVDGYRFQFDDMSYQNPPPFSSGPGGVGLTFGNFDWEHLTVGISGPGPFSLSKVGTYTGTGSGLFVTFDAFGALKVSKLTITPVPEPATWAMMIIGFGLVGASLRHRQGNYLNA